MSFEIRVLAATELERLLELIAAYQRFYGVAQPDDDRNRDFFAGFVAPSERGELIAAWSAAGEPVGYACLYWTFSSTRACEETLMNDLFVVPERRGEGLGLALIDAARARARARETPAELADGARQPPRAAPV